MKILSTKYLSIIFDTYNKAYNLGVIIMCHKHTAGKHYHIDIVIEVWNWFVEIQIGAE